MRSLPRFIAFGVWCVVSVSCALCCAQDTPNCFLDDAHQWRCVDHTSGLVVSIHEGSATRIQATHGILSMDLDTLVFRPKHTPRLFAGAPKLFSDKKHTPKLFAHRTPVLFKTSVATSTQRVPKIFDARPAPAIFADSPRPAQLRTTPVLF